MKIQELIYKGIGLLEENEINDTNIKARVLMSHILKMDKKDLIINSNKEVTIEEEEKYLKAINELIKGRPLQYITKNQEFMGLNFYVDENVLIPQPDTEMLVEEVLNYIRDLNNQKRDVSNKIKILDLCTGSGAIAVSIAKYAKDECLIYASDISENAINVARENAKSNNVNIEFILSNLFENITDKKIDIIVSNPPYIKTDLIKELSKDVQKEPNIALDGGKDGLNFYRAISEQAGRYLKENGTIFLEIGYDQKKEVVEIFQEKNIYRSIEVKKDLAKNDRVVIIKK